MARHLNDRWLGTCAEELDFPGSPWYEVKECISEYLVQRIRQEGFSNDELSRVQFFLGSEFMANYKLQESKASVSVVKNPTKNKISRNEKLEQMLKDLTLKAAKDSKCFLKKDLTESPKCFQSMVALVTKIYESSLNSHMQAVRMSQFTQYGSNTSVIALSSLVDKDIEILGEALVKILQKEPIRLANITNRLQGRLLPVTLRRLIYRLGLINKQKQSISNAARGVRSQNREITQQSLRVGFAEGTKAGMQELKSKDPTKSPLQHLIRLSVIEAYETIPGLRPHSKNLEIQKECTNVQNILYTYSRQFQRSYILWLFPLQVTISEDRYTKEHEYELAMWLNSIVKSCFPLSVSVNDIVLNVWQNIISDQFLTKIGQTSEINFSDHFSKMGIKYKKSDVANLLSVELPNTSSMTDSNLHKLLSSSVQSSDGSPELEIPLYDKVSCWSVSHPALCLRQWVTDLFVGVTDLPVMMFLWDQFFLHNWDSNAIELACLAIFHAMSKDFTKSLNVDTLCNDMMENPVNLKLHEVHRVWNEIILK